MSLFLKERTEARQLFPAPVNGAVVQETPPCLSWLTENSPCPVTVQVFGADGSLFWQGSTEKNYIVPEKILPVGTYTWDVLAGEERRGLQKFTVGEEAVPFERPDARTLFESVPDVRPRHLFFKEDIPALLARETELAALGRTVAVAMEDPLPQRPMFHKDENALPYREYFGRFRDFCDRDLVALSLAYALLGDEAAGKKAKELLLTICDWNPAGPCSLNGPWGDEVGLSCARCLPAVFDLLYPVLNDKERIYAAQTVFAYAQQCEFRLQKLDYCRNPGDSHAGRLPAYLGEAALVLKGTGVCPEETLVSWLSQALEIYGGIFPYYGTEDGGWAEGPFYASSYTKWYLPFFSAARRLGGVDFMRRPFYRKLTHFFLHFARPEYENHPFGDGYWCRSEDPEWPGFFAQNPLRVYADRFGPAAAKELSAVCEQQIDIYKLHLLDVFLPTGPVEAAGEEDNSLAVFPEAGFAALHSDFVGENDLCLLIRAGKFGSDSHRHPDQGSFALFWNGLALVSPSGYFGRQYGSNHHLQWTNTTRAHNALLLDGEGQYSFSMLSRGQITSAEKTPDGGKLTMEIPAAYPCGAHWSRTVEMNGCTVTIRDHVEAEEPVAVSFPLHTLAMPAAEGDGVVLHRPGVRMTVQPVAGDMAAAEISDRFAVDLNDGVPEAYRVAMPPQYHVLWTTKEKKTTHDLCFTLTVEPEE
ncbi:MAG: heparinase II/III family protein [Clostridia bacterium]|nr:heparinase II/III family protein [Clostridia bacterium]